MSNFEVSDPILSSPFEEPREHWWIVEGEAPERRPGRRFAHYFYRDPRSATKESAETDIGGSFGLWHYTIAKKVSEVPELVSAAAGV